MNENTEMIFEYPTEEFRDDVHTEFLSKAKLSRKLKWCAVGCVLISMLTFFTYSLLAKHGFIFFILTAVTVMAAIFIFKLSIKFDWHYLFIRSYDTEMELEYFSGGEKNVFRIAYENISVIRFMDKRYSSVKIKYRDHGSDIERSILILLNEATPEQGFFLYTAPQLIKKFKINQKIIEKKFGSEAEFYAEYF